MAEERSESEPGERPPGWRRTLAWMTATLAAAVGLSALAYADEESRLWPLLAFFTWAYLLSRVVIRLPGELGMLPKPGGEDPDVPEVRFLDEEDDFSGETG